MQFCFLLPLSQQQPLQLPTSTIRANLAPFDISAATATSFLPQPKHFYSQPNPGSMNISAATSSLLPLLKNQQSLPQPEQNWLYLPSVQQIFLPSSHGRNSSSHFHSQSKLGRPTFSPAHTGNSQLPNAFMLCHGLPSAFQTGDNVQATY